MGEIKQIIEIYIEDSSLFEDKVKEISHNLEANIQDVIAPGQVGYDTGHLHDTIVSDYEVDGLTGRITGWYGADYGQYWYRWKGGVDFLKQGLDETLDLYR
jgi:hypothetical protein